MKLSALVKGFGAALLAAIVALPASGQVGATILPVDALNGTDTTTSTLFRSIRYAVGRHLVLGGTSKIMVRGMRAGGNAVLHNDALEAWTTNGPIVVPPNLTIEWDTANSVVVGGLPTPVVATGSGTTNQIAFAFSATAALTRTNAKIKGLQIVAFETGVEWRPSNSSNTTVGATLDSVLFNQCNRGFQVVPASTSIVDPLVTACSFLNTSQPATILGDRTTGLVSLAAHVDLAGDSGDVFQGDYVNCLFTADAATPGGTAIFVGQGFNASVTAGVTSEFTVAECDFQGNGNGAVSTANGMMDGFRYTAVGGQTSANFLVRNSYFEACGSTGITLLASGQGIIATNPDGTWNYQPPETTFLTPEIRRCTVIDNGYVAVAMGTASLDDGHGIATRTFDMGQMQPFINLCNSTGTSAGKANLGITGNALDGVYIHSDWWHAQLNNAYRLGVIAFTRNDTWLETSRIYSNGVHGVEIFLQEGGGNPGVRANRVYDNDVNQSDAFAGDGVHVEALGAPDSGIDAREIVIATPVTWNCFIYNLTSQPQQNGFFGRFTQQYYPGTTSVNMLGGVGVGHNTSVSNAVNGIDVTAVTAVGGNINSIQSNIAFFNGNLDLVFSGINASYNCASNAPAGSGNITSNPLLVNVATGNLHLQTTPVASPCINAVPSWLPPPYWQTADDFDLQARPIGSAFEIGADEVQ